MVAKQREMCSVFSPGEIRSVFSPGEIEIYKALGEKRVKAEVATLTARVAESKQLRAEVEKQKFALQILAGYERAKLSDHMLNNYIDERKRCQTVAPMFNGRRGVFCRGLRSGW